VAPASGTGFQPVEPPAANPLIPERISVLDGFAPPPPAVSPEPSAMRQQKWRSSPASLCRYVSPLFAFYLQSVLACANLRRST
jgi:hypothetical protein